LKPEASNVDIAECEEQDEGQRSNRAQAGARRNSSGSLAMLAAIRRASSRVRGCAAALAISLDHLVGDGEKLSSR
jgi:hypothetical protein